MNVIPIECDQLDFRKKKHNQANCMVLGKGYEAQHSFNFISVEHSSSSMLYAFNLCKSKLTKDHQ